MKKRLAIIVLALVMCLSVVLAACATDNKTSDGLKKAAENVKALYQSDATSTPADYKRVAQVKVDGNTYPIKWSVDVAEDKVKVGTEVTDGQITISVFQSESEDIPYVLTATLEKDGAKEVVTFNYTVPKLVFTTIADFLAAKTSDEVSYALKGHVMATGADEGKAGSFVIADETGSVFSYNKFEVALGDEIIAYGTRSVNSGVPQLGTTNVKVVGKTGYTEATATELKAEEIDLSKLSNETITAMTGKYYKVTGVKYAVSGGYAQATYNGKQLLSLYTNTTISDVAEDYTGKNIEAYGYVRGFSAGKYLTIQVTKIVCTEEVTPKTAEEKVDAELKALTVSDIKKTGDVTLATTGKTYTSVKIAWAVAENEYATIKAGKLNVTKLPKDADAEITLTATLTRGDIKKTKEVKVTIKKASVFINDGSLEKPYTPTEAGSLSLEEGKTTEAPVYVKGIVKSFNDGTFMSQLYLTNESGDESFLVYSCSYTETVKKGDVAVGDTVVCYGYIKNYKGTIEMASNGDTYVLLHSVTAGNGTIEVSDKIDGATVAITNNQTEGKNHTTFTFTVTPATGKKVTKVTVNDEIVTAVENVYTGTIAGKTVIYVETEDEGATTPALPITGDFSGSAKSEVVTVKGWTNKSASKGTYDAISGKYFSSFRKDAEYVESCDFVEQSSVVVTINWYLNNTGTSGNKSVKLKFEAFNAAGTVVATQTSEELNNTEIQKPADMSMTLTGEGIVKIRVTMVKSGGGNIGFSTITIATASPAE